MVKFKILQDRESYQKKLDKMPPEKCYIKKDGMIWLKQDYFISRMNEIYGEENWAIENIKKSELKNESDIVLGYSCVVTLGYKEPFGGAWIKTDGMAGSDSEINNNVIGRAIMDAASKIGNTFGRLLKRHYEI